MPDDEIIRLSHGTRIATNALHRMEPAFWFGHPYAARILWDACHGYSGAYYDMVTGQYLTAEQERDFGINRPSRQRGANHG